MNVTYIATLMILMRDGTSQFLAFPNEEFDTFEDCAVVATARQESYAKDLVGTKLTTKNVRYEFVHGACAEVMG